MNFKELFTSLFAGVGNVVESMRPAVREQGKRDMTVLLEDYRAGGMEALKEFGSPTVEMIAGEPQKITKRQTRKK